MSRVIGVIPARMGSTRFPGKPLAPLCGKPMIEHVYARTRACTALDEVMIATCDDVIAEAGRAFGAPVVMTSAAHERATDRVAEAAGGDAAEFVVMVQGDEPMVQPGMVSAVVEALREDPSASCVNLAARIRSTSELADPNTIKVVVNASGDAMYFSRLPVPWASTQAPDADGHWCKQVCVIGFRRDALHDFARLPSGRLEALESIDMLRYLEHGRRVRIVRTEAVTRAVDTAADLAWVASAMEADA